MARILSVDLTTADQYIDLTGPGKLFVRISGADDVRIAFDQFSLSNGPYFTFDNGTSYIFDQPNPFVGQNCWVRADSSTATIQVLVSGGGIE
jgi:hypothetical protein